MIAQSVFYYIGLPLEATLRQVLMATIKDSGLLGLVKEELEANLKEIETKLEIYADEPDKGGQHLEACQHNFHQIAGVCRVVGMPAASMLADEMEAMMQVLAKQVDNGQEAYLEGLGQGVTMLSRYLAYVQLSQKLMPEVLLPTINDIRLINNKSRLPENYFFEFAVAPEELLKHLPKVTNENAETDRQQLATYASRLRHMYQVGFLGVIHNENLKPNLKLMSRALNRLLKLCGDTKARPLWQLGVGMVESFQEGDVEVNRNRKMLLGKLDRELKRLSHETDAVLDGEPDEELVKECIYVISLGQNNGQLQYKTGLGLDNHLSDKTIRTHLTCMTGPDGSAINAIVVALQEELTTIKEALDLSNRGRLEEQLDALVEKLFQVGKTLKVLELEKTSDDIVDWTEKLSALKDGEDDAAEEIFSNVADLLFRIENSVNHMITVKVSSVEDDVDSEANQEEKVSSTIFDEASAIVVKESRLGISHAKNAITSYMDSKWDVSHLVDVPQILSSVGGALLYLKLARAASIFKESRVFVEERLLESEAEKPNEQMMETLADALSSIDYYLEGLEDQKPIGDNVLLIAEESMNELGYPVAAA